MSRIKREIFYWVQEVTGEVVTVTTSLAFEPGVVE